MTASGREAEKHTGSTGCTSHFAPANGFTPPLALWRTLRDGSGPPGTAGSSARHLHLIHREEVQHKVLLRFDRPGRAGGFPASHLSPGSRGFAKGWVETRLPQSWARLEFSLKPLPG